MKALYDEDAQCVECGKRGAGWMMAFHAFPMLLRAYLCAHCIRVAGIILARAEKDAAKDQVPSPEGERK